MSAAPAVETLYQHAEILSATNSNFNEHQDKFKTILLGVKGSEKAKRLASQFIARFFPKFPELANESLDAILDLCDDDDINIRKQAIKDLPLLCREEMKEFLPKIADVLSQLLQTDDPGELHIIQNSLVSLFRKDPKGTIIGLFSQIKNGGDIVRERAIKFLYLKLQAEGSDLLDKQSEVLLIQEIKSTLTDCSAKEFQLFMTILGMTKLPSSVNGQTEMAEAAMTMAELDKPFDSSNKESIDRLIHCGETAAKYFSGRVGSTKFFQYFCLNVLPEFHMIVQNDAQTRILKLLAIFACYVGTMSQAKKATSNIYDTLILFMPLPPDDIDAANNSETEFEFTKVECLLYTFHVVARHAPDFLTENSVLLKDFRLRLQYFARGNQGCMKKLKEFMDKKSESELQSEENQIKLLAHRSTTNIGILIKDLFHSPPSYKAKIVLSWKQSQSAQKIKRKAITFDKTESSPTKSANTNRSRNLYAPPTGKYSSSINNYNSRNGKNGGGKSKNNRFY
uniref:Apoptosis inhibitor 5 n=1 Tax=Lepeophtheirus salmonis TaxID=72036 RepID=C1BVJ2_LEPSM|nr:Apoptosis inhibitor 5 [Lepeophtheirus salmonis]